MACSRTNMQKLLNICIKIAWFPDKFTPCYRYMDNTGYVLTKQCKKCEIYRISNQLRFCTEIIARYRKYIKLFLFLSVYLDFGVKYLLNIMWSSVYGIVQYFFTMSDIFAFAKWIQTVFIVCEATPMQILNDVDDYFSVRVQSCISTEFERKDRSFTTKTNMLVSFFCYRSRGRALKVACTVKNVGWLWAWDIPSAKQPELLRRTQFIPSWE